MDIWGCFMVKKDKSLSSGYLSNQTIADGTEENNISIKTNLDPKNVLENNPYYDPTKNYSKEELEKFKNFFGE